MPMKMKCATWNIVPGRPDINYAQALQEIIHAQAEQVDLLFLPQLCLSGSEVGSLWEEESFLADCVSYGQDLAAAAEKLTLIFGNLSYQLVENRLRWQPTICLAQAGKLVAEHGFAAFDKGESTTQAGQLEIVGLTVQNEELRVGLSLQELTADKLATAPAEKLDLLMELTATAYHAEQSPKLRQRLCHLAQAAQLPLLYLNQGGMQNTGKNVYAYDGACLAVNAQGELLGATRPFTLAPLHCSYDAEVLTSATEVSKPLEGMEGIYHCLRYGAQRFLEQCGIKKMTIGLSGGIDSAVTAALYTDILGPENVLLLNLPSVYNSSTTKDLAQELAYNLGANYGVVPIQESYEHTVAQLEKLELRQKDMLQPPLQLSGLVKENIQARDRGARVIAAAAAAFGGAFSCNSNKTEMSIGYCTFYGDLAGALALIGDLWKDQVYALGRYLNEVVFQREVIPEEIFTIRPSAELSSAQTVGQGGDPLHYEYHNRLFQKLMEVTPRPTPVDVLRWYQAGTLEQELNCETGLIKTYFPTTQAFIEDLERWWRLFTGFSVAKRIQAPPILSLSSRPYGQPFPEAQLQPYFSREYQKLKAELLK